MVTKATRDVIDLKVRAITDGILIQGDCSANFQMDGVTIGATTPCDGTFINLIATNLVVTSTIDGSGATVIGEWQATYSDIAECYEADKEYAPGTVVKIGGDKEITATDRAVDEDVFGVISTQPAYVLNSSHEGLYLPVVLIGRVPVRVIGPVKRGERMVSSNIAGVARAIKDSEKGCKVVSFGRVLVDDDDTNERLLEVAFVTIR
jgi:hypothetical protein